MQKSQVAVIGVGAVGSVLVTRLCQAGHDVTACVREDRVGLTLEAPDGTFHVEPSFVTDPESLRAFSWVIVATKAHQTASAKPWLRACVGEETVVVVAQNGVEHVERVSPFVATTRIVPVVVECPCERVDSARVRQRAVSRFLVPDDDYGTAFLALTHGTGLNAERTSSFLTQAWSKLIFNAVGGALTALTGRCLEVINDPMIEGVACRALEECVAVARAEGAELAVDESRERLLGAAESNPNAPTSLLSDARKGAQLEVDARNGVIVRKGEAHGIKTPVNDVFFGLLEELSAGEGRPCMTPDDIVAAIRQGD